MDHFGPCAECYEREIGFAGGCNNNPKLEAGFSDEQKATDQNCSRTLRLRIVCSEARRARRSVDGRVDHPEAIYDDEQGPSGSAQNKKLVDEDQENCQTAKPMDQDPDQAQKNDDKAQVGGASSLEFNFLDDDEPETVGGTTEPAEDKTSTLELESPSAFMKTIHNLPESSSPGKTETITKKISTESPRTKKKESTAEYSS